MVTRTEAIERFLSAKTHQDLSSLYNYSMEVQVNVAQDGGDRTGGEYLGKRWVGWSDGFQVWKSFRIPFNANTEPSYKDSELKFNFEEHVEGIGMTGWDWENQVSKWVAYDFDAIVGHSEKHTKKLSEAELEGVRDSVNKLPWTTLRQSTGGKGLHVYVFLDDFPTVNHCEHQALARSILSKMSALTGFDFVSKVDVCGGNMWVWHRKMEGTNGLKLLKQGEILKEIPQNWRDHTKVVKGFKKKAIPDFIEKGQERVEQLFEELSGQRPKYNLDEEHKKLVKYLQERTGGWWWDQDHHMLVAHTYDLSQAYEELNYRGVFKTLSKGRDAGTDHNCFCYPLRKGAWVVRRYTQGTAEAETWDQDTNGWTFCYLNKEPDLKTASRAYGGVENEKGAFVFSEADLASNAALKLGIDLKLPNWAGGQKIELKPHKDGRLVAFMPCTEAGRSMPGWLADKKGFTKIFSGNVTPTNESELGTFDESVRHLITDKGQNLDWAFKGDEDFWRDEPLQHIKIYFQALGLSSREINNILGSAVSSPWTLVNRPFKPEYIGDRKWNRHGAQLKYVPSKKDDLSYPTWDKIFKHIGSSLDEAIIKDKWCKSNGIQNGAEYLKCWVAALLQYPEEPLPYLFMYGPQKSGKSILWEALDLLMTTGVARADNALTSKGNFNAEIENAILCVVEETNLSKDQSAYNRIKDWVTARTISLHRKGTTPYSIHNYTHWIQCANDINFCPIFPGDTRIVCLYVPPLDDVMPKTEMITELQKEASDFLGLVTTLELPKTNDRLRLPIVTTEDKIRIEKANRTAFEAFVEDQCFYAPGQTMGYRVLYNHFEEYLEEGDQSWTIQRMGKELPKQFVKGRDNKTSQWLVGNISLIKPEKEPTRICYVEGETMRYKNIEES